MDPMIFGIATNLATDLLKVTYRRSRERSLGPEEIQALQRAFSRALGVLMSDIVRAQDDELTPDLVELVEGQLHRLVTDPAMADMLLAAALEERGPDPNRLRERFEQLGFDPQTFLTDFDTAMSQFRYALTDELLQAAQAADSPLFNRVALTQLAAVRADLAHLAIPPSVDQQRKLAGPHTLIRPTNENPDWHALLDGSPLPAIFGIAGILERIIAIEDVPYNPTTALEWLAKHPGRIVFLAGSRGDGKTSYLNALAAQSHDSHCFLRWGRESPFNVQIAEDVARKIQGVDPTRSTTVVIVYPIDASFSSADLNQLGYELTNGVAEGGRRAVVIVEGDDGTFERLPFYSAHLAKLQPLGLESVHPWVSLLRRAHDEVLHEGEDERHITARYPNLVHFLRSSPAEQAEVLADPQSPMIVRLLQAVYGANMWGKLYDELVQLQLTPPSPDAMCYLSICLATIAGRGIPTDLIEKLQPDAQWETRSLRNPWILDEHDQHVARHRTIAQVVLEKAVKRSNGRNIRNTMYYLTAHLRIPNCGALIPQIVITVAYLSPVASEDETDGLRKAVFYGARRGLKEVDGVASAIEGQCGGDYRKLSIWMEMVRLLIPRQSRDSSHLWLIDLHDNLLDAAERTENPPEPERLKYYRWKIRYLRSWFLNQDDYSFLFDAVQQVAPLISAAWCRADFYTDLFRWCFQAVSLRKTEHLTDQAAIEGRFLYGTLFTAYERLRSCTTEDRITAIRIDFNTMILRHVHWTLPDDAHDLIEDTWKLSVTLGCPDAQVGTLFAEMLLNGNTTSPSNDDAITKARQILNTVLDTSPSHGEAIFLLAFAQTIDHQERLTLDTLQTRITAATQAPVSVLSKAFIAHALALIETDTVRSRQLLLEAITAYMDYIDDRRSNNSDSGLYARDRLQFACDIAFSALNKLGGPEVQQAHRRYRRLSG
ncbi:hypothetical protein ACFHWS_19120 [Micromonospora sp. LOL_013]|uniref:hypothetical protein n=1 Tax=Micromonospora sp. LOL_013 TaxID=3345414 RepID=UPI003A84CC5A